MVMGNIGLPGLLLIAVICFLSVYPFWRLLPKFGFSKWLSIVSVLPLGMIILIWVLAFSDPKKETV